MMHGSTNLKFDSAEIKPAQCCIKLVFHLTYTMMHGSTKLKFCLSLCRSPLGVRGNCIVRGKRGGNEPKYAFSRGTERVMVCGGEHLEEFVWLRRPRGEQVKPAFRYFVSTFIVKEN